MNSKIKVLFVEENHSIIAGYKDFFEQKNVEIYFCSKNANIVLDNIKVIKPEVVFLDMFMTGINIVSVKQKAEKLINPPKMFFATSFVNSEKDFKDLVDAGFNHCFVKPFSLEIAYAKIEAIIELVKSKVIVDLDCLVSGTLIKLGVPTHLTGYTYLKTGITLAVQDINIMNFVVKQLYPTIAKLNNTTATRVERAIRHTIDLTWQRGNVELLDSYFSCVVNEKGGKPKNSEFIALISEKIILENKKINKAN